MDSNLPNFLKGKTISQDYYDISDPYKSIPTFNVNLREMAKYTRKNGKKLVDLTAEEVNQFSVK